MWRTAPGAAARACWEAGTVGTRLLASVNALSHIDDPIGRKYFSGFQNAYEELGLAALFEKPT